MSNVFDQFDEEEELQRNGGYQYSADELARQQAALDNFQKSKLTQRQLSPRQQAVRKFSGTSAASQALDAFVPHAVNSMSLGVGAELAPRNSSGGNDAMVMLQDTQEASPMGALAGQVAGFMVPGAPAFSMGAKALRSASGAMISPSVAARFTPSGASLAAKMGRYLPQKVLPGMGAGVVDYAAYEGTIGEQAREGEGATLGGRLKSAASAPLDPWAYSGALVSPAYRLGRGAVTGVKNSVEKSIEQGAPRLAQGTFTNPDRAAEVARQIDVVKEVQSDPKRAKAYGIIAKRLDEDKISQEQLNEALKMYGYGGYSSVDEMLSELAQAATNGQGAGQIRQLVVALANVGGDAQTMARTNLIERQSGAVLRMRDDLRKAAGIEGGDYYDYFDSLEEAGRTLPGPEYEIAYANQISDESWMGTVLPLLQTSKSAQTAVREAASYAGDSGFVEAARELDGFAKYLDQAKKASDPSQIPIPPKLSTEALDYIDRMLGDAAEGIRKSSSRSELARGPATAQTRLRSVLDPDTGINKPREMAHEYNVAMRALEFGKKAFKNSEGMGFEKVQREFQREVAKFLDENTARLFQNSDSSLINSALMMGWMRGAEDMIAKSTNPGMVIRNLFGSHQQREKMREMLLGLEDTDLARAAAIKEANPNLSPEEIAARVRADRANTRTGNSQDTKKVRQFVGDKYQGNSDYSHVPAESPLRSGRPAREQAMQRTVNETVGNSQTASKAEAIAAQGGLQRMAHLAKDAIFNAPKVADQAIDWGINRLTRPGIFDPEANRIMGEALFTGGGEHLAKVIKDLEQFRRYKPGQGGGGVGPVGAASAGASNLPQKRTASNGLPMLNNPTVGGAVAGGMAGGSMAQDLDGDGRVSMQERYVQGSLGALAGGFGGRAIGKLDDRMISQGSRQVLEGRANPMGAGSKGSLPMDEASRMARDVNEVDPSVPMPSHRRSAPREVTNMLGDGPIQYEARSATRGYKTPARLPGDVDISGEAASARYQFNGERFRPYDLNHSRQVIENVMRRHPNLNREVLQEELFYYGEHLSEGFSPADLRINAPDSGNSQEWRALSQYLGENLKMRNPPSASDSPVLTAGIGGRRGNLPMKGDAKQGGSTTTDRAVDAATLGVASGGFVGPADAEGVNYEAEFAAVEQDLQRAQGERQATLQRLQAAQDELAAWNARFNGQDRDVKAIQTFLRDNVNPDLAVDGDPRGQTATANQQYISRLEQAIIAQQEALAKNDEMVQSAEKRRADLENRQVYDQTAPNPAWDFVREKLPWVGAAAGIYAGYRTRGGTMRKARQKAEAVENQVEGLLKPSRGKNALSKDSHAVNEMHELGGSGPNVPFDDYLTGPKQGQPRARPNAAEIASLFPKASQNWSRADIAGSALWGLEGTAGTVGMMYSDANLQAAETRLRQLEDAPEKDLAAIKKARSDVEFWKSAKAISQASQMLGIYGAGINLAKGAVEKLPTPQPNKKKIADMRSSVAQRIQKRDQEHRDANR